MVYLGSLEYRTGCFDRPLDLLLAQSPHAQCRSNRFTDTQIRRVSVCDSNAKAKLKQPAQATNAASLRDATDSANVLVDDGVLLMRSC